MTRLTMLSSMADESFEVALETHVAWGLRDVDLKDCIFGKTIVELSDDEVVRVDDLVSSAGLSVYCLSSLLFSHEVEAGESVFRQDLAALDRLIEIAAILQPQLIRLLAPKLHCRAEVANSVPYVQATHPWLFSIFAEAIARISDAGYQATIENECPLSILSSPEEVLDLFAALRPARVVLTWDVQNMWMMGTFPSVEVYEQLRPVLGYYHVKGGQHDATSSDVRWRTSLEDASWPVLEITQRVASDGQCPVICLNGPHGAEKPGYDYANLTKRDIDFLRREVPGVEAERAR